jgi:Protein of unknown function (DUF4019)
MNRCALSPVRSALAALCLVWLATAVAQDPKAISAQAAARDWLALTDRGDAQASWNAASKKFRAALSLSGWADSLKKERVPLGAVRSRAAHKTTFESRFPGVPEGEYMLVAYVTDFANRAQAQETVTLERDADGKWRVVGYSVR